MIRFKLLLMLILTCLFTYRPALAAVEDASASNNKDRTPVYAIYDDVELTSATKYRYGPYRIVIKSVYPQLTSVSLNEGVDHFNDLILQTVNDEVIKFKQQVKEMQPIQNRLPKSAVKNDLLIDYNSSFVKSRNAHLISIRFSIQGFVGGLAHPYHHHRVINYNLDDSQQIALEDLFAPGSDYLSLLSEFSASILSKRLKNQELVAQGTAPKLENFKHWNIKSDGLLITFDENQVAPYVNGAQTVLVPYSILKSILATDSPIAYCITHQKKCRMNNLLTGGFIDEAFQARHRTLNPTFS